MFWIILGCSLFVLTLLWLILSREDNFWDKTGQWLCFVIVGLLGGGLCIGCSVNTIIDYSAKYNQYQQMNLLLSNDAESIRDMKKVFYKEQGNHQFYVDKVNEDLGKSIISVEVSFRDTLNSYDNSILEKSAYYHNRFFTCCYDDFSQFPLVKLSDFDIGN